MVGVLLSGLFFSVKVSRMMEVHAQDDTVTGQRTWTVQGQVFFASADALIEAFDARAVAGQAVRIDVSAAHFWDVTALGALDKVLERLKQHGCTVEVTGLDAAGERLLMRTKASSFGA